MNDDAKALILLVDDDYDFLELNRMILEKAGYRVVTASQPQQALEKMAEERPDLVITDLMMANLDSGFSLSQTIRVDARFAGVPVIVSTSVSGALGLDFRPHSSADLERMHVDAYFDKPLDREKLLAKVEELLGQTGRRSGGQSRAAAQGREVPLQGED